MMNPIKEMSNYALATEALVGYGGPYKWKDMMDELIKRMDAAKDKKD